MDIKSIKSVLDNNLLPDDVKGDIILSIIALDKNALPMILKILDSEREKNEELIMESNAELSRALITLQDPNIGKKKPIIELSFVIGEIKKHYIKWQNTIKCNFKIKGLP